MYDIKTIHLKVPNDIHQINKILIWSRIYTCRIILFCFITFRSVLLFCDFAKVLECMVSISSVFSPFPPQNPGSCGNYFLYQSL